MSNKAKPYVLTNTNSPAYWLGGIIWMPLATGVQTENAFTLIEQRMHNGSGPPSHHHLQDEGFYVIDGQCTFRAGDATITAGVGSYISVPRNVSHSFVVDADPTHVLNWYFPAGFEMILMSLAAPAAERTIPAMDAVPPPPRWMGEELSREYGQIKDRGLPFVDMPTPENSITTPTSPNPIKPYSASAKTAPMFWQQDILWSVLATAEQTGGSYSLLEELCPKGSGAPPHWHEQDEIFYMLDGTATFQAGDQMFEAGAGALVFIPRGTVHSFRVDSDTARLLNMYTPGGFERTVTELGQPATALTLPTPGLPMRGTMEQALFLFEQVGMHIVKMPDFLRGKTL